MPQDDSSIRDACDPESAALITVSSHDEDTSCECSTRKSSVLASLSVIRTRLSILFVVCFTTFVVLSLLLLLQGGTASIITSRTSSESIPAVEAQAPTWLIATMTPVQSLSRRQIIRSTWQKHIKKNTSIQCVFFIGQPSPIWAATIQAENSTYGDIISLEIEESKYVATHYKPFELYKYLRDTFPSPSWKFITKLDDDSYLSVSEFYTQYLLPNWNNNRVLIARDMLQMMNYPYKYPGGQMYTLPYPLAMHLADLYDANPIKDDDEDVLVGRLFYEVNETVDFVNMPNREAFDVSEDVSDVSAWSHQVLEGAINPHKMKTDEHYLKVAALFNKDGLDLGRVKEVYGYSS